MLERIPPAGDSRTARITGPAGTSGPQPVAASGPVDDGIPATPPTEVLDALDRAARVVNELGRKNVTLSLEHDALAGTVRVKVEQNGSPTGRVLSPVGLVNLLDGDTEQLSGNRGAQR